MGDSKTGGPVVPVERRAVQMKKSISLFHCVSLLCSVTGHVSVFVAPTAILHYTGSLGMSLIMWIFGGIMNMCLALCYTELGIMFPKSGGPYVYILDVFGDFAGFMTAWGYVSLIVGPHWAFCAYSASVYAIQPFYINCEPPDIAVKLLAIWILITFVAINCVYVSFVAKVQSILSLTKLIACLLIIACGVYALKADGWGNMTDIWDGTERQPFVVAMSIFFSVFTYGGWQVVSNLLEEVKNPGKDLPNAVYLSMGIIITGFSLVNLAYYIVLSKIEILQSTTVAVLFFEKLYPPFKPVISILVSVTAIGVLNCSILGHSRVLFAVSRHDHAPVLFSMINTKFFTPWPSIFILCVWSIVMLLSGGLFTLIELVSLFSILLSIAVVIVLLYLRWKMPDIPRPYKTPLLMPISQLILMVVVFFLCIYQEPYKLGRGLAIMAAGIPLYVLGIKWKNKPKAYQRLIENITLKVQKALLVQKSS